MSTEVVKPKRGRKAKKEEVVTEENVVISPVIQEKEKEKEKEPVVQDPLTVTGSKKRGRKPKGGKIIQQVVQVNDNKESKPNVILHLKCSLKDIVSSSAGQSNIECFNFETKNSDLSYEIIETCLDDKGTIYSNLELKPCCDEEPDSAEEDFCNKQKEKDNDCDTKEIWKKLKILEHNLHMNNISDKKSACFWCTCEFDNPPVYIPKFFLRESYHVYGCFCSPECSVAHLMDESIDSSAKFERYHLINHIYARVYDYKKNIKPAPNPYYLLDKYYGNLSIQEYRALLRNERLFLVVDKPLTRILPELHEDNDDFIINNKIIPSNTYQIKKKIQRKQQSKNTILNEKFGF
jgi:hypothetical protein